MREALADGGNVQFDLTRVERLREAVKRLGEERFINLGGCGLLEIKQLP